MREQPFHPHPKVGKMNNKRKLNMSVVVFPS